MRVSALVLTFVLAAHAGLARASEPLLFDFEQDAQGWRGDWGLREPPTSACERARSGKGVLAVTHQFTKKDATIGVHCVFDEPRDFTASAEFEAFSAWIYFPKGHGWQAQIYYHTGENWDWSEGTLYQELQPGWHQLVLHRKQMNGEALQRDIGIQVKNYDLNEKTTIYIDRVEALHTTRK